MRRLIYTAVFGGYDRVYPPIQPEPEVDHVIFTDDAAMHVAGWTTIHVDASRFASPMAANRFHKTLCHRFLPGYDASLYVDGNIRLLGTTRPLFDQMAAAKAAVAAYPHPLRRTVVEEAAAVIAAGKVSHPERVRREVASYRAAGFPDDLRLTENGVLLKDHRHPDLDKAMDMWWSLIETHGSRDQLSLPFVIWKSGLPVHVLPGSPREPNPHFALYPHHRARNVNPYYAHLCARGHDSLPHRLLLQAWQASWTLRRALRRRRSVPAP